jgi:hypothetical protein
MLVWWPQFSDAVRPIGTNNNNKNLCGMFQTESIQDNHFFFKPGNDIASIIKDFFF